METKPANDKNGYPIPPRNIVKWREVATDGYPTKAEYGPYPCVMVAMQCAGKPNFGFNIQCAELRFFGGDISRPHWVSPFKKDNLASIENDSWHVTHWTPFFAEPGRSVTSGGEGND